MAETNTEFGQAVADALAWLGGTPDTAGGVLGLNGRIVSMRSLIIRFATAMARQCEHREGAPAWWGDVDSWLKVAGCTPRRDGMGAALPEAPPERTRPQTSGAPESPRPAFRPPNGRPQAPAPAADEPLAKEHYHPVYERQACGDTFVHVFWLLDTDDRRCFQINLPAQADYKTRAAQVKQDLAGMSKPQFERKYGRFRVNAGT